MKLLCYFDLLVDFLDGHEKIDGMKSNIYEHWLFFDISPHSINFRGNLNETTNYRSWLCR